MGPLHYVIGAGGFALGAALAGGAAATWDRMVDDPYVIKTTRAACLNDAETAASRARLEQWRRNQEVIDNLNRRFSEQTRRQAAEQSQIQREMEDDIAAFETAGHSQCAVTVDNIEWLQPDQPGAAER